MRYTLAIPLAIVGCLTACADEPAKPADPVASLKVILVKITNDGTKPRVTDFSAPDKWCKARRLAVGIKYDVRKTDSLVSPFVATVTWLDDVYRTQEFPTRDEAEKAELPKKPVPGTGLSWQAKLAYQDGKWVVQDVGWDFSWAKGHWHSTADDPRDPVMDWWWAFGGEVPPNLKELERRASEGARRRQEEEAKKQEADRGGQTAKPSEQTKRAEANIKERERRKAAEEAVRWREWKRADGTAIGRARFMGMIAGTVKLKKEDETVIPIRLEDLSEEDRAWVQSRARPK